MDGLVSLRNAGADALFVQTTDLNQTGSLPALAFHFLTHLLWRCLKGRKRTQVEICLRLNARTRLQGGHFAIAHIQQSLLLESITHTSNDGQVHGIIGLLSREDFGGHRHPQWVQAGKHELELGQVGAVIFTVTQLQQPLFVDLGITAGSGGIDAHTGRGQVVDPQQLSHQFLLKGLPVDIIGEQAQHICQPIIGHILRAKGVHPASTQGFQPSGRPLLHPIHPVIGLRKNMGQPHHAQFTHTQSFPLTVGRDVFVQQCGHFHALHVADQQGDVIHPFCLDAQGFFHAFSLSESYDCVQI